MTNGSFSSKLTEALLRTQRDGNSATPAGSAAGEPKPPGAGDTAVPPSTRSVYEAENDMERLVLDFRTAPEKYVRLLDREAPLPEGIGALLEKVAERVKGLSMEETTSPGTSRRDHLIDATIFFLAKVLLTPGADHYRVLGLNSNAGAEDVHNHYRWLRRIFAVTEQSDRGQTVVMRISEAYVMLRDPDRRREYDRRQLGRLGHLHVNEATAKSYSTGYAAAGRRSTKTVKRTRPSVIVAVAVAVIVAVVWLTHESLPPPSPDEAEVNSTSTISPPETARVNVPEQVAEVVPSPTSKSVDTPATPPSIASSTGTPAAKPAPSDAALLRDVEKFVASTPEAASSSRPAVIPSHENAVGSRPSAADTVAVPLAPDAKVIAARQQEIQRLLTFGKQLVEEAQLMQPAGRNAYDVYQQVLKLDPQNEGAQQGLAAIAQRYVGIVRSRMQTKRYEEAVELADKGLAVQPDHEQLKILRALAVERASKVLVPAPASQAEAVVGSTAEGGGGGGLSSSPGELLVAPSIPDATTPSMPSVATVEPTVAPSRSSAELSPSPSGLAIIPVPPVPVEVPTVAVEAPPVNALATAVPESSVVATAGQVASTSITEPQLHAFINEFVSAYERGELTPFMTLFAEGARTNNQVSKAGIHDDYEKLFESSQSRLMRVRDVRWSYDATSAIGEGDYSLTVLKKGESRPRSYEGSLTFQLIKRDGQLQIKGLYHSQRKLTQ